MRVIILLMAVLMPGALLVAQTSPSPRVPVLPRGINTLPSRPPFPVPLPLPAVPEPQTVCALPNRVLVRINDGIATLTGQQCPIPIVVNVQVFTAQNFNFTALANLSLSYQWRSTDGSIVNQNSSSTTWQLPGGPGLHFAYVLVSNQFGGYREGRFFVNTDAFGNPPDVPMATLHFPTMRVAQPNMGLTAKPPTIPGIAGLAHGAVMPAPPPSRQSAYVFPPGIGPAIAQTSLPTLAAPPNANPFLYAVRGFDLPPGSQVYLADGNGNRFPPQGAVATDARGQWIIRFPPLANELLFNGTYNYGSITPPPTNSLVGYCASSQRQHPGSIHLLGLCDAPIRCHSLRGRADSSVLFDVELRQWGCRLASRTIGGWFALRNDQPFLLASQTAGYALLQPPRGSLDPALPSS